MKKFIPYRESNHGTFDEEWLIHRRVSGWWYVTGYLHPVDKPDRLFSFQLTLIRPGILGLKPSLLQLALTEVATGRHRFLQRVTLNSGGIRADDASVRYGTLAGITKEESGMKVSGRSDRFSFEFELHDTKGPVWHGDRGVLVMGMPDSARERTVYYSRTNLETRGTLSFMTEEGREERLSVEGKSWFDRQWGPFKLMNPRTHWEWFSLRFFDDEEVMLFAFPQDAYYDGTYIDRRGGTRRCRDYSYEPMDIIEAGGYRFSNGWIVCLPGIKEERYRIVPLVEGQLNIAYFELLAEIRNPADERVGLCVVELLPGARNNMKFNLNLLKKIEK